MLTSDTELDFVALSDIVSKIYVQVSSFTKPRIY